MMSKMMQKVHDLAMTYDKSLLDTDDAFTHMVIIEHCDGSTLRFANASIRRLTHPNFLSQQEKKVWDNYDVAADSPKLDEETDLPMIRSDIGWVIVFSEHNGTHVFSCDDLIGFSQYDRVHDIKEFKV